MCVCYMCKGDSIGVPVGGGGGGHEAQLNGNQ